MIKIFNYTDYLKITALMTTPRSLFLLDQTPLVYRTINIREMKTDIWVMIPDCKEYD